jgi:hypothetical protein
MLSSQQRHSASEISYAMQRPLIDQKGAQRDAVSRLLRFRGQFTRNALDLFDRSGLGDRHGLES